MPGLPAEMLRRLYQRGSLRERGDGFELMLTNPLAPGTIIGVGPILIDDNEFPPTQITVLAGRSERPAPRVDERAPVQFAINSQIRLQVTAARLTPGPHRLTIHLILREVGAVRIEVEDAWEG